jgi:hypothetical protein
LKKDGLFYLSACIASHKQRRSATAAPSFASFSFSFPVALGFSYSTAFSFSVAITAAAPFATLAFALALAFARALFALQYAVLFFAQHPPRSPAQRRLLPHERQFSAGAFAIHIIATVVCPETATLAPFLHFCPVSSTASFFVVVVVVVVVVVNVVVVVVLCVMAWLFRAFCHRLLLLLWRLIA